ncbi:MAG: hypothetical protein Greene07147_152 [Parcubacteria group bacterium Greene0714_7]|nr:MAG: hypothetical protein Greene07147_152 [Parcubacteria group bacterium Greene0714_7]
MKTAIKLLPIALLVLPLSVGAASLYGNTEVMVTSGSDISVGADVDLKGSDDINDDVKGDTKVEISDDTKELSVEDDASAEFKLFADDVEAKNENVEAVEVNGDGSVEVAYQHQARFLGFIPMKVTSHTKVKSDADGNVTVTVKLPWWSFQANAEIKANAGAQVSNETRAQIVNAIIASLNAEATASAQVEASAKAN